MRLITKSGERVLLGYSNEADDDPKFPFLQIGEQIARRAGVEVVHRGNIVHEFHTQMFGQLPKDVLLPDEEVAHLNRRHNLFLSGLVGFMLLLLLLGIGKDVWTVTRDSGERAPTASLSVRGR